MKTRNQSGITAVEALIILVVVALLGGAGFFVLHANRKSPTVKLSGSVTQTVNLTAYTDSANVFTLKFPSNWRITLDQPGDENPAPDWTKTSRSFSLLPSDAPKDAQGIQVSVVSKPDFASLKVDRFHTDQHLKMNGYDVYYDKLVFTGPSAAEKYTDDTYYVISGNRAVFLTFRESYFHNSPIENWNDAKDLSAFKNIVESVKFLSSNNATRSSTQKYLIIKEWSVKIPLNSQISGAYYIYRKPYSYYGGPAVDYVSLFDSKLDNLENSDGASCKDPSFPIYVIARVASSGAAEIADPDSKYFIAEEGTFRSFPDVQSYEFSGVGFHQAAPGCVILENSQIDNTASAAFTGDKQAFDAAFLNMQPD